jgi:hypothetical protein
MIGDCICAVNGTHVGELKSLSNATALLRRCNKLTLLILRHPRVLHASSSVLYGAFHTAGFQGPPDYHASLAAFRIYRSLYNESSLNCSTLSYNSNLHLYPPPASHAINTSQATMLQVAHIRSSASSPPTPSRAASYPPTVPCATFSFPSHTSESPSSVMQFPISASLPLPPRRRAPSLVSSVSKPVALHASPARHKCTTKPAIADTFSIIRVTKNPPHATSTPQYAQSLHASRFRNPLFRDTVGVYVHYDDDDNRDNVFDWEEGHRTELFLPPITDVQAWIQSRKTQWRKLYKVYPLEQVDANEIDQPIELNEEFDEYRESCTVPIDFWSSQNYATFQHWLVASTAKWKTMYSWNRRKRSRLEQECEEVVHLSLETWEDWLRVRKKQWSVMRRKRQRLRLAEQHQQQQQFANPQSCSDSAVVEVTAFVTNDDFPGRLPSVAPTEMVLIDSLLEEKEREEKAKEDRPPLDLTVLFDVDLGCPDDVVYHCLTFLNGVEHCKLMAVCRDWRYMLQERSDLWRDLCPSHWKLPRRPRKPWHVLYFSQRRLEFEERRKLWDDLLAKALRIMQKGDHLHSIEKLVVQAESELGFDINYSSGVVCERNSLLNLAVLHQRHKIVRWLVEVKKADIETNDRGSFTPLLNAAWAGDKGLVRFLLQKGASRMHKGIFHYTKPVSLHDFTGLTAEEWARKREHYAIAQLLRQGL